MATIAIIGGGFRGTVLASIFLPMGLSKIG